MRNTVGFEEQLLVALDLEDLAYVADAVPADVIDGCRRRWRRRIERLFEDAVQLSANGPSVTVCGRPLTSLPVLSSGWPGSLM